MTHEERIQWMALWAVKNHVQLELEGECGIGRPCVGITKDGNYPDYDDDVWVPENAYHKHPCVAVLGRGEEVETQLYDWIKWFDENEYTVKSNPAPKEEWEHLGMLALIMGKHLHVRMVKRQKEES